MCTAVAISVIHIQYKHYIRNHFWTVTHSKLFVLLLMGTTPAAQCFSGPSIVFVLHYCQNTFQLCFRKDICTAVAISVLHIHWVQTLHQTLLLISNIFKIHWEYCRNRSRRGFQKRKKSVSSASCASVSSKGATLFLFVHTLEITPLPKWHF